MASRSRAMPRHPADGIGSHAGGRGFGPSADAFEVIVYELSAEARRRACEGAVGEHVGDAGGAPKRYTRTVGACGEVGVDWVEFAWANGIRPATRAVCVLGLRHEEFWGQSERTWESVYEEEGTTPSGRGRPRSDPIARCIIVCMECAVKVALCCYDSWRIFVFIYFLEKV